MEVVSDLHLHSHYSRAVSQSMTLPMMADMACQKGIDLLTCADWTHPLWMKEIERLLEEKSNGIYGLKVGTDRQKSIRFLCSTEIASIFTQNGKLRRIHNLVFAPSLEVAKKVSHELVNRGCNLASDGRPIIGLSSRELLELVLSVDENCLLIPCHIWTPHFGMFGSKSGFNSIAESFGDMGKYIYGIETGLSSDPDMNWQIKELETRSILSFSDAHSPAKMGRELTVFTRENDATFTFSDIAKAIKRDSKGVLRVGYTIEFYPEEGKYHYSGHRNCKEMQGPEEVLETGGICRVCHKKLTEGVFIRVVELSDKALMGRAKTKANSQGLLWYTDKLHKKPPYVRLVPLLEVVAESLGMTVHSQKVKGLYLKLCTELGSELSVLLRAEISDIVRVGGERVAEAVERVRGGDLIISPGFDGEYGRVHIWPEKAPNTKKQDGGQLGLEM